MKKASALARFYVLFLLGCAFVANQGLAATQANEIKEFLLEVRAELLDNSTQESIRLNVDALENIGLTQLVTETPWTTGEVNFEGVLLRDLMDHLKIESDSIVATALNDYTVTIPRSDFEKYDVMIATRRDHTKMTIRDRGPLWVIYPWSDNPFLKTELYYSRAIWHLTTIGAQPD